MVLQKEKLLEKRIGSLIRKINSFENMKMCFKYYISIVEIFNKTLYNSLKKIDWNTNIYALRLCNEIKFTTLKSL